MIRDYLESGEADGAGRRMRMKDERNEGKRESHRSRMTQDEDVRFGRR